MEAMKDASHLYEVERRAHYAERPGFRINELQISPTQGRGGSWRKQAVNCLRKDQ